MESSEFCFCEYGNRLFLLSKFIFFTENAGGQPVSGLSRRPIHPDFRGRCAGSEILWCKYSKEYRCVDMMDEVQRSIR